MLYTRLCALLHIDHPLLNAPMSGTATGTLATAVSNAGGFGMIGGTTARGPDWLREQIAARQADLRRELDAGSPPKPNTCCATAPPRCCASR